ncbi:uncharacterized protein LOC135842503 [Planococcus citri]|uniref:uncharacterized protein LOC135842503 n=1 Tax=Planococcus citri TaxID=170843 RepID=UPI0031FA28D7
MLNIRMLWFYISSLLLHFVVLISTESYHHSSVGEYYVEWREVGPCAPEKRGTNEISANVRLTKRNRKPEMVGNTTLLIDFDESIGAKLNFYILGSNLAWLPNAYSMTFPIGCSGILSLLGEGWIEFMKNMNMPPRCPMRKGVYEVRNFDVNKLLQNSAFPKTFIYGRYKITVETIRKNVVVGCSYFSADVLPLWQKDRMKKKQSKND